jgi:hypothetical protein
MKQHILKVFGLIAFVLIALGSETTQQSQQRQAQQQQQSQQLAQKVRSHIETKCAGYGFKPGTDSYAQCLQNENIVVQQQISCQRYKRALDIRVRDCRNTCLSNARSIGVGGVGVCSNNCEQMRREMPPGCY